MIGGLGLPRHVPWSQLSTARKVRRAGGWLINASLVAMSISASTSGSDVGIRADGTKAERDSGADRTQGDPKVKAQRDQAGEANDDAPEPGAREAQGGNAADDTAGAESSA